MSATLRQTLPIAALILSFSMAAPARADLAAGMFAYDQGDYATALAEWTPLAENGDATAQSLLGLMYRGNPGMAADDATSTVWYHRAAEQGHAHAQYNLGLAYLAGRGVRQDDVAAYMWLDLAAQGIPTGPDGANTASQRRDALAAGMNAEAIAEAKRRSESWTTAEK